MVVFPGLALLVILTLWSPLVWAVPLLLWPTLVLLFWLKTRSLSRGLQFTNLMVITMSAWNAGFVAGYFTGRCRAV
jgi:hypothetical protein